MSPPEESLDESVVFVVSEHGMIVARPHRGRL